MSSPVKSDLTRLDLEGLSYYTDKVKTLVSDSIAKIASDAPEAYDTLKEIGAWIESHSQNAMEMDTKIKSNAEAIEELKGNVLTKDNTTEYTPDNDYNPSTKKYVDDTVTSASTTINESVAKANSAIEELKGNVLTKDNTTEYTPDNDYNPSTKKYVDDTVTSASTTINESVAKANSAIEELKRNVVEARDIVLIDGETYTAEHPFNVLEDMKTGKIYVNTCVVDVNAKQPVIVASISESMTRPIGEGESQPYVIVPVSVVNNQSGKNTYFVAIDKNGITTAYRVQLYQSTVSVEAKAYTTASDVLTKNNTVTYTPSTDYHPATKKYVDDSVTDAGVSRTAIEELIESGKADINNAAEQSVTNINEVTNTNINNVNTAANNGVKAVTDAINNGVEGANAAIGAAQTNAVNAVATRQTEAIDAVNKQEATSTANLDEHAQSLQKTINDDANQHLKNLRTEAEKIHTTLGVKHGSIEGQIGTQTPAGSIDLTNYNTISCEVVIPEELKEKNVQVNLFKNNTDTSNPVISNIKPGIFYDITAETTLYLRFMGNPALGNITVNYTLYTKTVDELLTTTGTGAIADLLTDIPDNAKGITLNAAGAITTPGTVKATIGDNSVSIVIPESLNGQQANLTVKARTVKTINHDNLLDISHAQNGTNNSITMKVDKEAGTYTLSGKYEAPAAEAAAEMPQADGGIMTTANKDTGLFLYGKYAYSEPLLTLPAGTYYAQDCFLQYFRTNGNDRDFINTGMNGKFTLTEEKSINCVLVRVVDDTKTYNNEVFHPAIWKGSVAKKWAKYNAQETFTEISIKANTVGTEKIESVEASAIIPGGIEGLTLTGNPFGEGVIGRVFYKTED